MCSGRVDMAFVLKAFANGTDGVLIGGCHFNECHYITDGNYHTLGMVLLCRKIMEHIGLNPARLRLVSVSAGEGIRFAEIMNEFGAEIRALGPVGAGEGIEDGELTPRLSAVMKLVPYIKLVEMERLHVSEKSEEAYRQFYAGDEFDRLFNELIADKLAISQILMLLEEKPLSTGEMSGILGLSPSEVSRYITSSSRQGLVRYDTERKRFALP
jgi:coenzyme F420-reducing hydrogenase delta subunit